MLNIETLKTDTPTFEKLFRLYDKEEQSFKLVIPPYQRPYVWNEKKLKQLLSDLDEYARMPQGDDSIDYYMGTVILHLDKEHGNLNIVDGQQRITTLLIIDYVLNGENSILISKQDSINFSIRNSLSKKNLQVISSECEKLLGEEGEYHHLDNRLISKLRFTAIITSIEDDAFTFFDSQNNRGVQPSAVDVLKAVHLRGIVDDTNLQENCASTWEKIQNVSSNVFRNSADKYLDDMVGTALWRIRRWTGSSFENDSTYDTTMVEFGEKPRRVTTNSICLYPLAKSYKLYVKNSIDNAYPESIGEVSSEKPYSFSVRQPLQKGVCFFSYIKTYHEVVNILFNYDTSNPEILKMRELYKALYIEIKSSRYMSDFFIMLLIFYYDRFGTERLYESALWIDNMIGQLRMDVYYFKSKTIQRFITSNNILDKIQLYYEPEEFISYMSNLKACNIDKDIPNNSPVNNYKKANYGYFNEQETEDNEIRKNKPSWIKALTHEKVL